MRIALDLSCAMERQPTGIGYAAAYQVRSLVALAPELDLRFVATRPMGGHDHLADIAGAFTRRSILPHGGLLRHLLWSHLDWPPIEWFSGPVDIAHNFSHQAPVTRKARSLVTVHDLSFLRVPETHSKRNRALQMALLAQSVKRASAFVTVSQIGKCELVELAGVDPERIYCVPNGICPAEYEERVPKSDFGQLKLRMGLRRDYFIHLGTVEPRKNIPRLLQAHERLCHEHSDAPSLVLAGKAGWLSEPICAEIRRHEAAGRVIYAGYVERTEALALLRNAVACVYPSLYEGFGLPVLEAMASGTVVITSNRSSLPEVVGETGYLVNPESVDEIHAAMAAVLDRPAKANELAVRAWERAKEFTWENSARRLLEVYRNLV